MKSQEPTFKLEALLNTYYIDYGIQAVDIAIENKILIVEITGNKCNDVEAVIRRLETQITSIMRLYNIIDTTDKFKVSIKN